jgi:hypothetical protein
MEAELFIQPPGAVPIPLLADADGQLYGVAAGISRIATVTLAIAGGAYVIGNTIGTVQTLTGAARAVGNGSGMVYGATLVDPSRNTLQVDLLFFSSNPTASAFTDKAEAVIAAADIPKVVGSLHVSDWTVYGATTGVSVGNAVNAGILYVLGKTGVNVNTSLFAVVVARASLTLPAAGYQISVKLMPD